MSKIKVLLVDDEETLSRVVGEALRRRGYEVCIAYDGIQALEEFSKERPHISLIDVHMPYSSLDGVEVLRKMKEVDKDALCLMLTRVEDKDKVEESKRLGALAYILKPLDLDTLVSELKKAENLLKKGAENG